MDRLSLAAVECNYKEIDRQLKEKYIHRLNDNDILVEIIRENTRSEESKDVTSEQVLARTKWVEAQNAQSTIMHSLNETKHFDNIKTVRGERDKLRGNHEQMPKCQQKRGAVDVVLAICPDDALTMERTVESMERSTTLERLEGT